MGVEQLMLSRVADSLYWMARYLERAEHTSRLVAVKLESMIEQTPADAEASWVRVITAMSAAEYVSGEPDAFNITRALAFERANPSSVVSSLNAARENARQVREQLSTEVWEHLNRIYLGLKPASIEKIWVHEPAKIFRDTLRELHTLEGLTHSTISHGEGWWFLELGRYIERAQLISRLLDIHFGLHGTPFSSSLTTPKYFDWLVLLKFCTAFEPYCKAHTAAILPTNIAEFLLFNAEFPHSLRFAVDRVREALAHVARSAPPARRALCERLAGRLKASVDFGQVDDVMGGSLDTFLADITRQCEEIHEAIYGAYITYGAETVL